MSQLAALVKGNISNVRMFPDYHNCFIFTIEFHYFTSDILSPKHVIIILRRSFTISFFMRRKILILGNSEEILRTFLLSLNSHKIQHQIHIVFFKFRFVNQINFLSLRLKCYFHFHCIT